MRTLNGVTSWYKDKAYDFKSLIFLVSKNRIFSRPNSQKMLRVLSQHEFKQRWNASSISHRLVQTKVQSFLSTLDDIGQNISYHNKTLQ